MQTLVRSMPDLHKNLILANVVRKRKRSSMNNCDDSDTILGGANTKDSIDNDDGYMYEVEELSISTEHAPFRHQKNTIKQVGAQRKGKHKTPKLK